MRDKAGGGKVASMSDGEMTSGFGPFLIRVISITPGCSNSHPPSPLHQWKGEFSFLASCLKAVVSQFAQLTCLFLLGKEEIGKIEPRK